MVTRVDRLARSIRDLQDIVYSLNQHGITLRATEQPVDTRSAAGKAFLDMLGVFVVFETNLPRMRQMEGIAAAKARGVYRGRKPSIDPAEVYRLYVDEKMGATAILPASWVSDGHRSTGCWITMSNRRKSIPSDSLLQLRQRLDRLPPKSPERAVKFATVAQLYGVSATTVYRSLHRTLRPRTAHRRDHGRL